MVQRLQGTAMYLSRKARPKTQVWSQSIHTYTQTLHLDPPRRVGLAGTNKRWTWGHNCNVWQLQCQVKHVGSTGQQPSGKRFGRSHGWRHLQPSDNSITNMLWITTRGHSTIDLALVSPRIAPWLSAETLTPHGSDHLLVVFSFKKKTAKKQNIKPHNPFLYERSGSDIVSKLCKQKSTQSMKGSQKSKKQPSWWDSEIEKAWTEQYARNWQKGRTQSNPDPSSKLQWVPKLSSSSR